MNDFLKTIIEILPPILGCIALFAIGFAGSGGDLRIRRSICWAMMVISVGLAINVYLAIQILIRNN